jgi:N-methylhydantoinase A
MISADIAKRRPALVSAISLDYLSACDDIALVFIRPCACHIMSQPSSAEIASAKILGVDVGGTFTDFFLTDPATGATQLHKVPSTPDDPSRAILAGLEALVPHLSDGLAFLAHGTTVATNALIQRRGGKVALVTTAGFKDLIEIGRQTRPKIYDLKADNPEPLVLRQHRFEVTERVGPKGEVITALDDADIARVVAEVERCGADSVAVCFLFSFLNPAHEQRVGVALRRALPKCDVSLSCEVQPEFREYERLSTTVLNAFLQPVVGRYMANLQAALARRAPEARIGISLSSGGLMSIARASALPIRTALSGPAAGVVGAIAVGRRSGHENLITFDMGGTSTDVCLVRAGHAEMAFGRNVASFPVRLPAIDIHTVGAGGGSIAFIDKDGLLKVGPRSAGAVPGPACYGLGGTEPTVTDANIVLGRLPAELVGGGMRLDRSLAEAAVASLGKTIGLGVTEAALGIVRIVNSNMVRAIRAVSIERGFDPRLFTLMPFGGAGALHAVDVARELHIRSILVPPAPGILCAEGVASASLEEGFVATCRIPLSGDLSAVVAAVRRLQDDADTWFAREDIATNLRGSIVLLDMRYVGQNFELPIPVADGSTSLPAPDQLARAFLADHKAKYGHADPNAAIEIVNVRLLARAQKPDAPAVTAMARTAIVTPITAEGGRSHRVWFDAERPHAAAIIGRAALSPGAVLDAPAIITQFDATTVLSAGCRLTVLESGSLLIEVDL